MQYDPLNHGAAITTYSTNPEQRFCGKTMKKAPIWFVIVAVLLVGFILYRYLARGSLNVTPEAQEQIDKAKRR